MSVTDLLRELEHAGVRLWEDSGQLRYRAPRGVMTEERLDRLKASKAELVGHLQGNGHLPTLTADPATRLEPFPLSDVQAAYLLGRRDVFDYGGVACHGYGELEFGELEPARMELAWRAVIARHDMLSAVVDLDGSQRVLEHVPPYEIAVVDLRGQPAAVADDALRATRAEMDHRVHDPSSWPLFELRITLTDERAYLHVSIDFLIADFVSIQLLLDELHRYYADPQLVLAPLEPTFRDYLLAERRLRSGARYERDREWWLRRLEDLPPAPELPSLAPARGRPVRFTRHQLWLERDEWAALRGRAGANAITPSAAVLAAYAEVVGRWSRRAEFTLDLTVLNRLPLHPQVGRLIGDFTSVELLAVRGRFGVPFAERASALQAQLFEDLDHRLFSGVELLREISRRRGPGSALFPIVFTSAVGLGEATGPHDSAGAQAPLGELGYGISQTPQVWIDCQVMERQGRLSLNWDVRQGVFPEGVLETMFAAFEQLLRELARDDAVWARAEPVALPSGQLERRCNVRSSAPLPHDLLHEGAIAQALRDPDRIAVIDRHGELSYGELLARALSVAELLRDHGGAPGDRVAVIMDKGREQVIGVLGVLLAGAAYVPVDTHHPPARRELMLTRAGVRLALTQSWLAQADADQPQPRVRLAVDAIAAAGEPLRAIERCRQPDELAYVIFTSGSTGTPKGVMITHRAAQNTIADVSRRYGILESDRVLGLAALGFDLSVYDVFGTLGLGGCLVLPDPSRRGDPSHWAQLIERHEVTVWNSVPAQLQMLGDYLRSEREPALPTLRLAMLSGDWIPVSLPDQIRGRLPGLRLISMGGATEAAIWSIFHPIEEVPESWHSIPYGRPLANQTVQVLDEQLRECADFTTGELYIGGAGLALGYLDDEAQTRERFIRHPTTGERLYRTGDLGRYLPHGEIEFLGREDSQVKIRGHRIELAEIEAALVTHPGVDRATAIVHGSGPLERSLAAFVEPRAVTLERDAQEEAWRAVRDAARQGGADALEGIEPQRFLTYMDAVNDVALLAMTRALCTAGLFAAPGQTHDLPEILERTGAAPAHHRLLRRWLRALTGAGMLTQEAPGRYGCARDVSERELSEGWERAAALADGVDDGAADLLAYFRASTEHLPALLRGERDPLELLFPDGRIDVAEALYQASLINRWATAMLARAAAAAAERVGEAPLRVLEVGAGVGGSTSDVLATLAPYDVDYLFTDLSRFFINIARERFGTSGGVRFGVYDLDRDYREQGLAPNSFDLVLAADVLHSTRHVGEALARLRELIAPGGWLLFVEMTRDQYQIMASLELLTRVDEGARDFLDIRRGRDQTFLTGSEWVQCLRDASIEPAFALPLADDPLAALGMQVLAGQVKSERAPIRPAELSGHLRERLPEFMIPARLQIVDGLPVTANGKIDQETLRSWLAARPSGSAVTGAAPKTDLELRISQVWAEMFGVAAVERDRGFFELGGDSLLAAQVAGRLREVVAEAGAMFFDDLLRALLEGPTVAGLADKLSSHEAPAELEPELDPASPVVALAPGRDGAPLVLVHGPDWSFGGLEELASELAAIGPVLGLRRSENGGAPADGFGDRDALLRLAAGHARALCADGHLAVHLVGLGLAGALALEIARALLEAGAEVESLTVMDRADGDALELYSPDPYLGDVRLLQPTGDPQPARERAAALWSECCLGELELIALPGAATTVLGPDSAPALRDALLEAAVAVDRFS